MIQRLKEMVLAKDGTVSLHKVGNLVAQVILGIAVGYAFYIGKISMPYLFIYMGVISGNSMILQAAEYLDKKSPTDLNKAQRVYHKVVQDVIGEITYAADTLNKGASKTAGSTGTPTNSTPTTDNPVTSGSAPVSGTSADSTSTTS